MQIGISQNVAGGCGCSAFKGGADGGEARVYLSFGSFYFFASIEEAEQVVRKMSEAIRAAVLLNEGHE